MTTKIANILQCYALGMGIKQISRSFELSRNTVRRYVRLFQECGIPIKELAAMPSARIQEMFSEGVGRNREPSQRQLELEALLPEYAARLSRRGVTVKTLYEEYRETHPDGYRHASFGNYLMRYRMVTHVVGHVEHYAGDQMYIDFAGDKLEVVDSESGECRSVEVFVAILPCSHYTYCEAVWSQSRQDLIKACENALHFYGGVPMAIVPDNLKSAVTRSDRNEPVINEEFAAFAEHYGCTVYPTRVRHPKDKALVENAVKLLYRSVYADIEGLVFHSLESLNAAISESLSAFNGRRMSGRPQSRREQFEQIESDCLRPLPAIRHQMKERRSATVMRNGYVTFRLHHYSVPKEYIGKRVEIVYDADTLEIYHGLRLVTTHQRDDTPYSYTTKDAHGLPGRHGSYEKDLEQIYERAGQTDNVLLLYLRKVAELKKYPPAAFRSCRGIMALEKTFGLERLVAASACATQLRLYGYQEIRRILERGDDADFLSKDDIDDEVWKIQCKLPPKTKRFYPLKTFNNAPLKSLDRWGYYYFSLFPSVCIHFTDTFSCQLNPVRRMYNTIHNGICYCRVSDCIIPIVRWQLRGDDDGLAPMSVLYYIEQDGSFLGIKVHKEEVIQYEQRAPFDSLEFRFQCAFYFCHLKRTHKFRSIRIICPYALLAGFIPHCCGKEALPGTG